MQDLMLKFPHLSLKIFQKLDCERLLDCREVARSWQNTIDGKNYPWLRIVNIPTILIKWNSYLHHAAATGQIEAFKIALDQEGDLNIKNEHDETSFHLACKNGRFKIAQLLLQNTFLEIDFNAKDSQGFTAFHFACQRGHFKVVKVFVEFMITAGLSVDLRAKTKDGDTAFYLACVNGHSDQTMTEAEHNRPIPKLFSNRPIFTWSCQKLIKGVN